MGNDKTPRVIVLCGRVASGKTTLARTLARQGGVILSIDDVMLRLYDGCLGREMHEEAARRISAYFDCLAPQLLEQGLDVIFDYGYWTRRERDEIVCHYRALGVPVQLIYLNPPEAARLQALQKRNEALQGSVRREYIIDGGLLRELDARFEEPASEEAAQTVTW